MQQVNTIFLDNKLHEQQKMHIDCPTKNTAKT